MQSNLQQKLKTGMIPDSDINLVLQQTDIPLLPPINGAHNHISRGQQFRILAAYIILCTFAAMIFLDAGADSIKAFALGLFAPGAGFFYWAGAENPAQMLALLFSAGAFTAFLISIVIWIGTGNVVLPAFVWLGAAWFAGSSNSFLTDEKPELIWSSAFPVIPLVAALAIAITVGVSAYLRHRGIKKRNALNTCLASITPRAAEPKPANNDELSKDDLQLMRLILDRALQPIARFDGFEWIDQFQTAAVRYQLSFMSYGLSMAQSVYLPAFGGYLNEAQENLAKKQQNHLVWRYWKLENMWGNLRRGDDPVAHDNIMYSGFVAAQLAYYQNTSGMQTYNTPGSFSCNHPSGKVYAYSLPEMVDLLKSQYDSAKFGLLACEPNWIYPLCNFITASAVRAHDAANGSSFWEEIEGSFRYHLEREFIRADGQFVPFRSSYTGIAVPQVGGAVMQAFPCLFLNTIMPDLARRQWAIFRQSIKERDLKQTCWPIDVGNYRFSRAASYAATAAAAVELGDSDLAIELLQYLDDECPAQTSAGVVHRDKASLWAHSVELMARCGKANTLLDIVASPATRTHKTPFIKKAQYPNVLVAKAINEGGGLSIVLYPGDKTGFSALTIGGLLPGQSYIVRMVDDHPFSANTVGEASLNIPVDGRTELRIIPIL